MATDDGVLYMERMKTKKGTCLRDEMMGNELYTYLKTYPGLGWIFAMDFFFLFGE